MDMYGTQIYHVLSISERMSCMFIKQKLHKRSLLRPYPNLCSPKYLTVIFRLSKLCLKQKKALSYIWGLGKPRWKQTSPRKFLARWFSWRKCCVLKRCQIRTQNGSAQKTFPRWRDSAQRLPSWRKVMIVSGKGKAMDSKRITRQQYSNC